LGFVAIVISNFILSESWYLSLKFTGENITLERHHELYFYPKVATYAPGGFWSILLRVKMAEERGISKVKVLYLSFLELVFIILTGFLLYLLFVYTNPALSILLFTLSGIAMFLLFSKNFQRLTNVFFLLKKGEADHVMNKKQRETILGLHFLHWLVGGLGFFFLIQSVAEVSWQKFLILSGIHSFSWVVAFLAPFAAGGLGVMEVALMGFLAGFFPPHIAVLITLLVRLVNILAEVVAIGAVWLYNRGSLHKIFKKSFLLILVLGLTLGGFLPVSANDHRLIVSEVLVGGAKANHEFVEIYNPSNLAINLKNWRLVKKTASGSEYNLIIFSDTEIDPQEFLVISHPDYQSEVTADFVYATSNSIASNNTVMLKNASKEVIDKVGFGMASDFEGEAAPNPEKSKSLSRPEARDTDNNKNDFAETAPNPGQWPSSLGDLENPLPDLAPNIPGSFGQVIITELLPDPQKPQKDSEDEWIEIFNAGGNVVNLSGWKLKDTQGRVKEFALSGGINPGEYKVLKRLETKISLNNDGDAIELYYNGAIVDSTPNYGKTISGASFALIGAEWAWTQRFTPGAPNILEESLATAQKEKKAKTQKEKKSKDPKTSKTKQQKFKGKNANQELAGEKGVLGLQDTADSLVGDNQKIMGLGLMGLSVLTLLSYLVYANKEKVYALFKPKG